MSCRNIVLQVDALLRQQTHDRQTTERQLAYRQYQANGAHTLACRPMKQHAVDRMGVMLVRLKAAFMLLRIFKFALKAIHLVPQSLCGLYKRWRRSPARLEIEI